ncbi:hypothetical protein NDU88_001086 [Pleurodeles waltl]|uniref:Uncharacterized protein n=1 Tax=Pleurodeles waltl TaxID=8319 RepID=A0AAV7SY87_PLEWA|nr:hypothetical protein NDU88_001086 [Pleurodeles waltl]
MGRLSVRTAAPHAFGFQVYERLSEIHPLILWPRRLVQPVDPRGTAGSVLEGTAELLRGTAELLRGTAELLRGTAEPLRGTAELSRSAPRRGGEEEKPLNLKSCGAFISTGGEEREECLQIFKSTNVSSCLDPALEDKRAGVRSSSYSPR